MMTSDGTVLDWADEADTVRVQLRRELPGSVMQRAFWNLAGDCRDSPDLHVCGWHCHCEEDLPFTD